MPEKESQLQLSTRLAQAAQKVHVGGRYRHYKQPQATYKVIALGLREADNEPCIIYQAEYGDRITFIRPVVNWLEQVNIDGKKVNRFTLVT